MDLRHDFMIIVVVHYLMVSIIIDGLSKNRNLFA